MGHRTTRRGRRLGRIRRLLMWLPHWAVALLLLLPIMAVETFELLLRLSWLPWVVGLYTLTILAQVAFVIPGALKRLNWRHILVMLGIGAALGAHAWFFPWRDLPIPFFYAFLLAIAMAMIAVALGEWALTTSRSRRALALVVLASVTVACAVCVVSKTLLFCGWRVTVPIPGTMTPRKVEYAYLVHRPLLALLMWVAIPLSLRAGRSQKRRAIFIFGGTAAACAAAFLVFFHSVIYTIAEDSLGGQGLFHKGRAAELLGYRARDADLRALRAELDKADWSVPRDLYEHYDWRAVCIHYLGRHHPKATADYLCTLLRSRPTPHLASFSANLLAKQRRYEAVPILTRYALLADGFGTYWCVLALEDMKLPRATLPLLRDAERDCYPTPLEGDFRITQRERERLTSLLGKDVGANLSDWVGYYEKVIDDLPTPLPQTYTERTDRVIRCIADYREAQSRLFHGRCVLMARWLREDGEDDPADATLKRAKALMGKSDLERLIVMEHDQKQMVRYDVEDHYYERAVRELAVQEPNLDVPTTEDLRREIDKYVEAVRKATAEALKETHTAPATRKAVQ